MQPNKKPKGYFNHPGLTGFKFKAGSFKERFSNSLINRMASAFVCGIILFLAALPLSPIMAFVMLFGALVIPFTSMPVGILGTGGAGAGEKTAEEKLMEKFKSESDTAIQNALKKFKEEDPEYKAIKDIQEAIKKLKPADESIATKLREDLDSLGIKVKELAEKPAKDKGEKTLTQLLEEKKAEITSLKDKKGSSIKLDYKSAGTMTTANVTAVGSGLSMILNRFEGPIVPLPRSAPFFSDLFAQVPTDGNTISYAEMKNPDGGAGMTGEGSAKTQADFDIIEAKTNVRKVTSYIKTSKEALDDIPALAGEINNELITLVNLKKDSQVLSGDGLSNNLKGALEYAQAFTGGSLAGTITSPNNYDVLVAAIVEIATAEVITGEPAGFMANTIVMNPVDVAAMKLTKDKNDNYIFPVTLPGQTVIMEVPVVSNARMTAGSFLVMDSTKGNLRIREGVTIDIGYENDDFTKNLVTILAEMRLAFYIKSQHVKAFVKGTFEAAIEDLTENVAP